MDSILICIAWRYSWIKTAAGMLLSSRISCSQGAKMTKMEYLPTLHGYRIHLHFEFDDVAFKKLFNQQNTPAPMCVYLCTGLVDVSAVRISLIKRMTQWPNLVNTVLRILRNQNTDLFCCIPQRFCRVNEPKTCVLGVPSLPTLSRVSRILLYFWDRASTANFNNKLQVQILEKHGGHQTVKISY